MPLPCPGCKKDLYLLCQPKINFTPSIASLPSYRSGQEPSVRPIGAGDTVWQILAKAVLLKPDVQEASGYLQMCGRQIFGIKTAVHAVRIADSTDTEAVLLVNATNTFNSLNHQVALQSIRRLCPPLTTILINTYRAPTELFVDGDILLSQEGTMQGDPLSMFIHVLTTIPG